MIAPKQPSCILSMRLKSVGDVDEMTLITLQGFKSLTASIVKKARVLNVGGDDGRGNAAYVNHPGIS